MAVSLLATKLYIPPVRPELVARPRLLGKLKAGLDYRLILICAPAGFGKTTLLSEWVHDIKTQESEPPRIAWVSLDAEDSDPIRFWVYFVAAMQQVHPGLGESALAMLHSSQPPPSETVLTLLINEAASLPDNDGPTVVVLDDYHHIEAQSIHAGMAFLVQHLPRQLRLVITGRSDPVLPLARLRASGHMFELRTADLRFTPDETAAFLNDAMGLELSEENIAALEARTEGWITGLQLAALSLRGQARERVATFIETLTGSHRYILDYLSEEVLQRHTGVQSFLLQTSILERMTGDLCDAITGQGDGQATLESLEQANLFVLPLDSERRWYRYHHLFADLLRTHLQQKRPDEIPDLHRRASTWYASNGLVAEAVGHAVAAGDVEEAASLVEQNALAMLDRRELTSLVRWLDSLSEVVVCSRPWLCVARAWALVYAGQPDAAEALLYHCEKATEQCMDGSDDLASPDAASTPDHVPSEAEARRLAGHIAAIRADISGLMGDRAHTTSFALRALEQLPEDDRMARGFAATQLAHSLRWSGDLERSVRAFTEAIATSKAAGDSHVAILSTCGLVQTLILRGELRNAADACQEALRLADESAGRGGRKLPAAGYAHIRLSSILREQNDLENASFHAREGLKLCELWEHADVLIDCYLDLAKVLHTLGDRQEALGLVRKARGTAERISPWIEAGPAILEAQLLLAGGFVEAACRAAAESGLTTQDELDFQQAFGYPTLARLLIARGRLGEALEFLARVLDLAERAEAGGVILEVLILQAIALQAQGQTEQALATLERALLLAEPERYVRLFVEAGAPMLELLQQVAAQGIADSYVTDLLGVLDSESQVGLPRAVVKGSRLVESLTERELEVLHLLAIGLPNKDIAQTLFITVGTVKNHLKNLYGKLGVDNRMRAVARAREIGLLDA